LEGWVKARSAIAELVNIRKKLGTGSHKKGIERRAQAQVRDAAQEFVCLVFFLHRICLPLLIMSPTRLLPAGCEFSYLRVRRSMYLNLRSHELMTLAFRRGRLPSTFDLHEGTIGQSKE
jgi:hypothetical protein